MKLTCVTAVWNAIAAGNRDKLIRCVKTVGALKTEHEHLLMDGASTDGTVELLRELEKEVPGLKVLSSKDTGIYNALNKGLAAATGEWFYVLGSDDFICRPEVMDALIANEAPETEMIVAPVEYGPSKTYAFHKLSDLRGLIRGGYGYCHQGLIMKTAVARKFGGFDERFRLCADGDLLLKVHRSLAKFHYTFEAFANFSPGGANETNRDGVETETMVFLKEQLGLTDAEAAEQRRTWRPPFHVVRKYYRSKDVALWIGARDVADEYLSLLAWSLGLWRIGDFLKRVFWHTVVRIAPAYDFLRRHRKSPLVRWPLLPAIWLTRPFRRRFNRCCRG